MPVNKFIIWLYLFFVLFIEVRSQVCTRNVRSNELQEIPYKVTYKECKYCKIETTLKSRLDNVPFKQLVTECCHGYKKKFEHLEPSSDNCVAICNETVCKNGHCSEQNDCICYGGYEKHPAENTCIPKCGSGYIRDGIHCKPKCKKPCLGGRCNAPDVCTCDSGWETNERDECIQKHPTCDPPCGNGTCMHGNKCNCQDGYEFNETTNPQCVPSCWNCEGICVAPGRCECPENKKPKYLTADRRDCDCSEDCDKKCYKMTCVLVTSTYTTTITTRSTSEDPSTTPNIGIIVQKSTASANPTESIPSENDTYSNDNGVYETWLGLFIFIVILIVVLSALVIWELYRKP